MNLSFRAGEAGVEIAQIRAVFEGRNESCQLLTIVMAAARTGLRVALGVEEVPQWAWKNSHGLSHLSPTSLHREPREFFITHLMEGGPTRSPARQSYLQSCSSGWSCRAGLHPHAAASPSGPYHHSAWVGEKELKGLAAVKLDYFLKRWRMSAAGAVTVEEASRMATGEESFEFILTCRLGYRLV